MPWQYGRVHYDITIWESALWKANTGSAFRNGNTGKRHMDWQYDRVHYWQYGGV